MHEALAPARAKARVPVLNLALFAATVVTTLLAGAQWTALRLPEAGGGWLATAAAQAAAVAVAGLPFAAALIGILFCHEMGHYLLARAWRVDSTLPFFIPVPVGPVGTFGAVIRIRSALPSRTATLDIGAAGPLAGFAVALPLLFWGLAHSVVQPVGDVVLEGQRMGLVQLLAGYLKGEALLTSGVQHYGDSFITWGVQRLVWGKLPPGHDVFLHPVAFAAWIGLFITTLNLIPLGQLDGGHVTYALLGRRGARRFSRAVSFGLLLAGLLVSWNWFLWWGVTRFFVGYDHPPALVEEPLTPGRKLVAVASILLFLGTFIPVPVSL
ncbi:site-2 protease family protein [Anaeromyxobacter diazotrophicus]|uniref:Metalloprotease n=1 Tax=Anaeromyxobacter diazotrophicus TaxID=2590199 RepID=A0A7I9VMN2_9BACT|nr:site-2 protease family protein [Anaeromyxobacter diazotrophicus]GEJ57654.1 metalloprotease [Anaeromyxobacter diazotrophicus]